MYHELNFVSYNFAEYVNYEFEATNLKFKIWISEKCYFIFRIVTNISNETYDENIKLKVEF